MLIQLTPNYLNQSKGQNNMTITSFGATSVTESAVALETNATPLDYSTLKIGMRLCVFQGQKPNVKLVAVSPADVALYLSDLPDAPKANFVDMWAVDGGEALSPIEYEKSEIVKAALSAWASLKQQRVFHSSISAYLSRNPEEEVASKNGVGTYGYLNSDYKGGLVLQGVEIPAVRIMPDELVAIEGVQTARRVMFTAKKVLSLNNTKYQAAKAEFETAHPDFKTTGERDSKLEAIGAELGHAKAAFWKMEMIQMLLQGKAIRVNTFFAWDYAKALINAAEKFSAQPKAGAKFMMEQVNANKMERKDYLGRLENGPAPVLVGYKAWGTESDVVTLEALQSLPFMTKIEVAPDRSAGSRIGIAYFHLGVESDLKMWLSTYCVRDEYALRVTLR
jgi:hypothetical protein